MRASSTMKLLAACCGGLFISLPGAIAQEDIVVEDVVLLVTKDTRDPEFPSCENQEMTRYLQLEIYEYNLMPSIKYTWNQLTDACGNDVEGTPFTESFEYDATVEGGLIQEDITYDRLVMQLFVCAPWGDYELVVEAKSTNGETDGVPNEMNRFAFQVENAPDEFHIWDSVNTPHRDNPDYSPFPPGGGESATYRWPLEGSEGYYSNMYSGPMPPLICPNLHPDNVVYVGCFEAGQYGRAPNPTGSTNNRDAAELLRMFDGIDDDGIDADDQIMTVQKCKDRCAGYQYFSLESGVKCFCSSSPPAGDALENCGFEDDEWVWEYRWLCSGESRVQCGTRLAMSVYEITDGPGPTPAPAVDATPSPVATGDVCPGGVPGIPSGDGTVCCDVGCMNCGGTGCNRFPGGAGNCCIGGARGILANADVCSSAGAAPCIIDADSTPAPVLDTTPSPVVAGDVCPGGVPGIPSGDGSVCCDVGCINCGGTGCNRFPGGAGNCCIGGRNGILQNADVCSSAGAAPCVIDA